MKKLKTNILKKINQRVRIVKNGESFEVQSRKSDIGNWIGISTFASHRKALDKKHNYIVMIVLRDLGFRSEFANRRKKRKG